jgi:hypothetical protein
MQSPRYADAHGIHKHHKQRPQFSFPRPVQRVFGVLGWLRYEHDVAVFVVGLVDEEDCAGHVAGWERSHWMSVVCAIGLGS